MVLNRNKYDAAYFGDLDESGGTRHTAGYSNYLELETNYVTRRNIVAFLTRHNIPKTAKILELGAGVGFMGLVATEQGYTDWTCVDWSNWAKRHEVFPVIEEEAQTYLELQTDNFYDYIISRAAIECVPQNKLQALAIEAKRVAVKQIHSTYLAANLTFYNIKTLPQWEQEFLNDPDIIVEDFREDG